MNKLAGAVLMLLACAGIAFAQKASAPAALHAESASVSQTLQRMERDWLQAEKDADVAKLDEIIADDWVGIGIDGEHETKQQFLASVKSGASKMDTFEVGPMSVKSFGYIAVVQGGDTEKSVTKGKDSSGKYAWMDVFVKRQGKWVAVRSQTAMVH